MVCLLSGVHFFCVLEPCMLACTQKKYEGMNSCAWLLSWSLICSCWEGQAFICKSANRSRTEARALAQEHRGWATDPDWKRTWKSSLGLRRDIRAPAAGAHSSLGWSTDEILVFNEYLTIQRMHIYFFFFTKKFSYLGKFSYSGKLHYNVGLIFAIHQHELAIGVHKSPPSWVSLPRHLPLPLPCRSSPSTQLIFAPLCGKTSKLSLSPTSNYLPFFPLESTSFNFYPLPSTKTTLPSCSTP